MFNFPQVTWSGYETCGGVRYSNPLHNRSTCAQLHIFVKKQLLWMVIYFYGKNLFLLVSVPGEIRFIKCLFIVLWIPLWFLKPFTGSLNLCHKSVILFMLLVVLFMHLFSCLIFPDLECSQEFLYAYELYLINRSAENSKTTQVMIQDCSYCCAVYFQMIVSWQIPPPPQTHTQVWYFGLQVYKRLRLNVKNSCVGN